MTYCEEFSIEEWRPVIEFEGWYEISSLGRLRRVKASKGARSGYILSPALGLNGYYHAKLSKNSSKDRSSRYIHHLVSDAFMGPCPAGKERNHIDGCKTNNRPSNLEFVTSGENTLHASALGLLRFGEKNHMAKITGEDVMLIRRARGRMLQKDLASQLGVSQSAISVIQNGKSWKHVA